MRMGGTTHYPPPRAGGLGGVIQTTTVVLEGTAYVAHGVCGRGENATSALLPGLTVDVSAALDAE